MKFSQIVNGAASYRVVDFPLVGNPDERSFVSVKLRPLSGDECVEVLKGASALAVTNGGKAEGGDPHYELGLRVHTVLRGVVDVDAPDPEAESARFFASVEEILGSELIGRDGIWFLYECQETWQDYVSPNLTAMGESEFYRRIVEVAESNDPLVSAGWRPAMQWSFMRSMARQLLVVLNHKSPSGPSSSDDTMSASKQGESHNGDRKKGS